MKYTKLPIKLNTLLFMNLLIGLTSWSLFASTQETPTPQGQQEETISSAAQAPQETHNAVHLETRDAIQDYLDTLSGEQKKELFKRLETQSDRVVPIQKPAESIESSRLVKDLRFKKTIITQFAMSFVAGLCLGTEFETGHLKSSENCQCYCCKKDKDSPDVTKHDPFIGLTNIIERATNKKEDVAFWRESYKNHLNTKQEVEKNWRHSCHEYRISEQKKAYEQRRDRGRGLFSIMVTLASASSPLDINLSTLAGTWACGLTLGAGFYHFLKP